MIVADVGHAIIQPAFAARIGRFRRIHAESVEVGMVVEHGRLIDFRVGGEEPRRLHAGQREGLGDRLVGDRIIHHGLVVQGRERNVLLALADEVAMDFVRQHEHIVLEADFAIAGQFFLGPGAANQIIWVAEDRNLGVAGVEALASKSFQSISQRPLTIFIRLSFARPCGWRECRQIEAVIDRRRHQHFAAGGAVGGHGGENAGMHARGDAHIAFVHGGDAITLMVPVHDALEPGFAAGLAHVDIAPIVILDGLAQGGGDGGRGLEVHVRDAHAGDEMIDLLVAQAAIPFHAVMTDAIGDIVEVVGSGGGGCGAGGQRSRQGQRQNAAADTGVSQK